MGMDSLTLKTFFWTLFVACISQGCKEAEFNQQAIPETWELIEIKSLDREWQAVHDTARHLLKFLNHQEVEFIDHKNICRGNYEFVQYENALPADHLILRVPCMVLAPQLYWEHAIEIRSEEIVITFPRLNPAAYAATVRHKYKITYAVVP